MHSCPSITLLCTCAGQAEADGRPQLKKLVGESAEALVHRFCIIPRHQLIYDHLIKPLQVRDLSSAVYMYVRMCVPVSGLCMCVCIFVCVYACMYVSSCICACLRMCARSLCSIILLCAQYDIAHNSHHNYVHVAGSSQRMHNKHKQVQACVNLSAGGGRQGTTGGASRGRHSATHSHRRADCR